MAVDEEEARAIAQGEIDSMQAEVDAVDEDKRNHGLPVSDVEYVITTLVRISDAWCAMYDNRQYIETGNFVHALAGNGPILVSDEGVVGRAGSALPVEYYVSEFESGGLSQ